MTKTIHFIGLLALLILLPAQVQSFQPFPDTGQTMCYDADHQEVSCDTIQPGDPLYGQDGHYQPRLPRSYTKLGHGGVELSDNEPHVDDGGDWIMTRDNVTGLIWELKTKDNKDDTYTFPNSQSHFIADLNDSEFGGYDDWRLPSREELSSLVNRGNHRPAIDKPWFPFAKPVYLWTSTINASSRWPFKRAWLVLFYTGHITTNSMDYTREFNHVRAVRAGQSPSSNFVDNQDGTVTDPSTGLMWQKCSYGQEWDAINKICTGSATQLTWQKALEATQGLTLAGHNDWRLPNINELQTLVDDTTYDFAIDTNFSSEYTGWYRAAYLSSTSDSKSTNEAWFVDFIRGNVYFSRSKSNSYNIRAVRAGQSDISPLEPLRIEFSPIGGQIVNEPFEVGISIRQGNWLATQVNGPLNIYSSTGRLEISEPQGVVLQNGKWIGNITMLDCAGSVLLQAHGHKAAGKSDIFSVSGCEITSSGMIIGNVLDSAGNAFSQVSVKLYSQNKVLIDEVTSDNKGEFSFQNLEPGRYEIVAQHGSFQGSTLGLVESSNSTTVDVTIRGSVKPLLIVPGIMASTISTPDEQICFWPMGWDWDNCIPQMPKKIPAAQEQLYVVDPSIVTFYHKAYRPVQLREFRDLFWSDYSPYMVPWDWRYDIRLAWKEYLKPIIDQAKFETGFAKVDIVAHSMGGLLVRAYMQSWKYDHDIDKFVMLGTPNLGSSNTYFIEEGGDPLLVDEITTPWYDVTVLTEETFNFYYQTIRAEMQNQGYSGWYSYEGKWVGEWDNAYTVRKFLAEIPTLNQLAPTYSFLYDGTIIDFAKFSRNTFLDNLNKTIDDNKIYSADNTRLFLSDSKDTISLINIDSFPTSNSFSFDELYPSGNISKRGLIPSKANYVAEWDRGDGTVPAYKSSIPFLLLDNKIVETGKWGKHSSMFANEDIQKKVYKFLLPEKNLSSSLMRTSKSVDSQNKILQTPTLLVSVTGYVQPLVIDSQDRKSGVDSKTLFRFDEFGDTELSVYPGKSFLSVNEIDEGLYTVRLHGRDGSTFKVEFVYSNGEDVFAWEEAHGYHESGVTEFQVDLTQTDSGTIINQPLEMPTSVNSYEQEGNTTISWDIILDPEAIGYRVYGKCPAWPDFRYLGSTVNDYFETDHAWNDSGDEVDWRYLVVSESEDGILSFYEKTVRNRTSIFLITDNKDKVIAGRHHFVEIGEDFFFQVTGGSGNFEVTAEVDGQVLEDVLEEHGDGGYSFSYFEEITARVTIKDLKTDQDSYFMVLMTDATLIGDVNLNGRVDMGDAFLILRHAGGLANLTDEQKWVGNITGHEDDDSIGIPDVNTIVRILTGQTLIAD